MNHIKIELLERERNDKNFARSQVSLAIKRGTIKREPCICGETKVEAHHADYSKPLDVMWVCKKHHIELDKMRTETSHDMSYGYVCVD